MKKFTKFLLVLSILSLLVSGCGKKTNEKEISIGLSPRPHREIIEFIKDDLEKEGYTLKIVEFTDYIKPNDAVQEGELDANFFQHEVYLDEFNEQRNFDLVSAGAVHIEPMGLYSNKISAIDELKDGDTISIPNDVTNGRRALLILEKAGLIKIDEKAGALATEKDIVENPLNLTITPLEAAMIPKMLDDVDAAIINGNYALEADLTIDKAIISEEKDSPYANIIAVKSQNIDSEKTKTLMKVLQSDKVREFIETGFENSIIPGF